MMKRRREKKERVRKEPEKAVVVREKGRVVF